jgi:hypothetical protein
VKNQREILEALHRLGGRDTLESRIRT